MGLGQASHQFTSRMTIWSAGYRVRSITPLEDKKALDSGAELVGEGFVLGVSLGWLFFEYDRGRKKDTDKELKRRAANKAERDALRAKFKALDIRVKALEDAAAKDGKGRSVLSIGSTSYIPPDESDLVPIQDSDDEDDANVDESSTGSSTDPGSNNEKQAELAPTTRREENSNPWWKVW